jgi:signal transduction histidine kinase
MTSFLGVPIRIGDRVFGNLYLTQKQGGHDFTDEDESAVVALASTAAVAIENARLYQDLRQREAWLAATADIQRTLLGTAASHDVLHLVVERVCQLTGAQLAAIVLEQDDLSLRIEAVEGSAGTDLEGRPLPKDGAMVDVIDRGATVYLAEGYRLAGLEHLTSALLVPFTGPAGVGGALLVGTTVEPGPQRTRSEIEALHGFAAQASLSLERAQAQEDRATLALQADRDRIARDLHDLVIQRLFATGVSLEGATRMTATEPMISRMRAAITALDETIKEIRETIFELGREPAPTEHTTFRGQLHDVTRASASMLGFPPRLRIDGPVDALVPEDVRPHLVAVLVESLANAARHARASTLLVTISVVVGGDVVLTVEDDGRGFNHTRRHSGLLNMADRAISLGGTCVVDSTPGGGTRVTWRVPIDGPRRDRSTIETLDPSVEPPPAGVLDS